MNISSIGQIIVEKCDEYETMVKQVTQMLAILEVKVPGIMYVKKCGNQYRYYWKKKNKKVEYL